MRPSFGVRMSRAPRRTPPVPKGPPTDLVAVAVALGVAFLSLWLWDGATVRVIAGAVTLLFLPGYVTAAALFPRRSLSGSDHTAAHDPIGLRERAVVSLGLSVALLPILALVVGQFTDGFTEAVAFGTVAGYVLLVGVVAWVRRRSVPVEERLSLPVGAWRTELRDGVGTGPTRDRLLTVALVASVLLAGGAFGYAAANPADGETYTDFHLLTTNASGEQVSAGYPDRLERGETASVTWGIESHEAESTAYTVVVVLERVSLSDDGVRRIETAELDRESATVAPGEQLYRTSEVRPTIVGEDLRLSYYLYRGVAPDRASPETAYRHLYVWVDVGVFA